MNEKRGMYGRERWSVIVCIGREGGEGEGKQPIIPRVWQSSGQSWSYYSSVSLRPFTAGALLSIVIVT